MVTIDLRASNLCRMLWMNLFFLFFALFFFAVDEIEQSYRALPKKIVCKKNRFNGRLRMLMDSDSIHEITQLRRIRGQSGWPQVSNLKKK